MRALQQEKGMIFSDPLILSFSLRRRDARIGRIGSKTRSNILKAPVETQLCIHQ